MPSIIVVDYDPEWPRMFEQLREKLWTAVGDFAVAIEHVGSTSVPGLAAKPIIDLSIVVTDQPDVELAIERLAEQGYRHLGDLGIEGREAFENPPGPIAHHLYLCPSGSLGLRNHLALRNYLRSNPETAAEYAWIKKSLAERFPQDIDSYLDGKIDIIQSILRHSDLTSDELASIAESNRNPSSD